MKKLICVLLVFLFSLSAIVPVFASGRGSAGPNASTFTYADGNLWVFMRTQDAYIVSEILFTDNELNSPEDLALHNGVLYVADTGNRRIVALDLTTRDFWVVADDIFNRPTGIFISHNDELFVADNGSRQVFRLDLYGNLLQTIGRPTDVIFGEHTSFIPQKVLVDHAGIIYIVSEGTFDGIIQLADDGSFIGFFGINNLYLSPLELLQNLIFTEAQRARLTRRTPLAFTNMALDNRGLVRTVTQHSQRNSVRVHNVAGADLIAGADGRGGLLGEMNFVDIAVGRYGQMYAVTSTGLIYEYTQEGFYVFTFGGRAVSAERGGIFTVVSAIEVDDYNNLFVLDRARGMVHVYSPTNFAASIHRGIYLHERGHYEESLALWRNIRRESGSLRIVNIFMGRGYFQLREYHRALYYFRLASSWGGYSDAFWEIRNVWLVSNMNTMLIVAISLYILLATIKQVNKRRRFLPDLQPLRKRILDVDIIRELLFVKDFIKHPVDSFHYLRYDTKGSTKAAAILMVVAYMVFIASFLGTGFLFGVTWIWGSASYALLFFSMMFIPAVALFVGCNYLVASITDGRGRFKDVFNLTAYSFSPFILFMPILIILSHFLTFNEAFVMSIGTAALWVWVGVLIFIGLKEIHDFDISVVWKNIFLTIGFAFIVIVVLFMIYMFWDNLIDMVYSVFREAGIRARR